MLILFFVLHESRAYLGSFSSIIGGGHIDVETVEIAFLSEMRYMMKFSHQQS